MTGNGEGSLPSFPETAAEPSQDAGFPDGASANRRLSPMDGLGQFTGWFRVGGVNQAPSPLIP